MLPFILEPLWHRPCTAHELVLLRAWIHGVPLSTVDLDQDKANLPFHSLLKILTALRYALVAKAQRFHQPWADFFNQPRQSSALWKKQALMRLHWLQMQPNRPQQLNDPLLFWLETPCCEALSVLNLHTISDWLDWRALQKKAWWCSVTGLGTVRAHHIEQRLSGLFPEAYAKAIIPKPPMHPFETGVVPLVRLALPATCDGANGLFRGRGECFIPAQTDLEALHCWLARFDKSSHSYRAYQREVERLLLWAVIERQKALSSLTSVDIADFRRFLQDPTPRDRWVGKPLPKNHPGWKPFTGGLSKRSVAYADTVLGHLFSYWLAQGYVRLNPYHHLPPIKHPAASGQLMTRRGLSLAQWQFMQQWLDDHVQTHSNQDPVAALRLRLAMRLLYATGLRLHELAQAVREDVQGVMRSDQPQAWLQVVGKGGKRREVPLAPQVYQLLIETHPRLVGRSWQLLPAHYPLIPPLRGDHSQALSPSALYKVLKSGFSQAAQALQQTDPVSASHLQNASSHWLRHSHASHTLDHNVPLTVVRDNLGHSSLAVTSQYLHSDHDQRHQAIAAWEAANKK